MYLYYKAPEGPRIILDTIRKRYYVALWAPEPVQNEGGFIMLHSEEEFNTLVRRVENGGWQLDPGMENLIKRTDYNRWNVLMARLPQNEGIRLRRDYQAGTVKFECLDFRFLDSDGAILAVFKRTKKLKKDCIHLHEPEEAAPAGASIPKREKDKYLYFGSPEGSRIILDAIKKRYYVDLWYPEDVENESSFVWLHSQTEFNDLVRRVRNYGWHPDPELMELISKPENNSYYVLTARLPNEEKHRLKYVIEERHKLKRDIELGRMKFDRLSFRMWDSDGVIMAAFKRIEKQKKNRIYLHEPEGSAPAVSE